MNRTLVGLLLFFRISLILAMFCNYYPIDPEGCVKLTEGIQCRFDEYENQCLPVASTSLGCSSTLNRMACLNQRTYGQNVVAKCYFQNRCLEVLNSQLVNLGCSTEFSVYACTSVTNKLCYWDGSKCQEFVGQIPTSSASCTEVFGTPVVAKLCAMITNLKCNNLGLSSDNKCIDTSDSSLTTLKCSDLGISSYTCSSILTENEQCIFMNSQCQNYVPSNNDDCTMKVNKLACLSISKPDVTCEWKNFQCQFLKIEQTTYCNTLKNVNSSTCLQVSGQCYYDNLTKSCLEPSLTTLLNCNTPGLSKAACYQLNQECTFIDGYCKQLTSQLLDTFSCSMKLNKKACTSLTTKYQYCKWADNECINVIIDQDFNCEDMKYVNGNVCRAIIKEGCRYNSINNQCILSVANDTCSEPYMNLLGCVGITDSQQSCQWQAEQCQTVKIVKYSTLCTDLIWVNRVTCSQIYQEAVGIKRGCYYSPKLFKCLEFDSSDSVANQVLCLEPGLNQIGCSLVQTAQQICKWERTQCLKIQDKMELAQTYCLSLRFVNAAACALTVVNSQHCKYAPSVFSCIPTVDIYNDGCETLGLNDQGCGAIQKAGESCIYDQQAWKCLKLNLSSPNALATALLATANCTYNSPTKDVCVAITRPSQKCIWSYRIQACQNQLVSFNQPCKQYFTSDIKVPIIVNINVCSSILMDNPNGNDLATKDQGYCFYNKATNNCIVYDNTVNPCTSDCCENLNGLGINAHVCSRFSNQNVYCYFNDDLKCVKLTENEVDITSETLVKQHINELQFKCSQVNSKACHMIDWSSSQLCFYDGTACINLSYDNYDQLSVFYTSPAITNKYTCTAIEAVLTVLNTVKYFGFDETTKRCQPKAIGGTISCSETNININACLGLTSEDYCTWNKSTYTCEFLDSLAVIDDCSKVILNQKACNDLQGIACKYSKIRDQCQSSIDYNVNCTYFDTNFTVSAQTCQQIAKDGQSCKYDTNTKLCVVFSTPVIGCNVVGANISACFAYTSSNCRWNTATLSCYEALPTGTQTLTEMLSTLKCTDSVNKQICLQLLSYPCKWNATLLKCENFAPTSTEACPVDANNYNSVACQQIIKDQSDCVFDLATFKCKQATSNTMTCTQFPMNKIACLLFTRTNRCQFDPSTMKCNVFLSTVTECATPNISLEVCVRLNKQCVFNMTTGQCLPSTINSSTLCTGLNSSTLLPNIQSCTSIYAYQDTKTSNQICINNKSDQNCEYQRHCTWDPSSYQCAIIAVAYGSKSDEPQQVEVDCPPKVDEDTGDPILDPDTGDPVLTPGPCYKSVIIKKCRSQTYSYTACQWNFSEALCLQVVQAACYFDYNQGGCINIKGNEGLPPTCESANYLACSQITNPLLKCQQTGSIDYTPGCDAEFPALKCVTSSAVGSYCSTLSSYTVNASVCATASNECYFNGSSCSTPSGTLNCDILGLSQTSCLTLPQCKFENNQCQYAVAVSVPSLCSAVQLAPINASDDYRRGKICSQVVAQPCKFSALTCVVTTYGQECTAVTGVVLARAVCTSCINAAYKYNILTMDCTSVTEAATSCDNLNMKACMEQTPNIYCVWSSSDYKCTQVTQEQVTSLTTCAVLNALACPYANAACWINAGLCQVVPANSTCLQIQAKFGGSKSCSVASDACYYDATAKQCAIVPINTVFSCQDAGLSLKACVQNTFSDTILNKCFFLNNSCGLFSSIYIATATLTSVNKYACLSYDNLKGWNATLKVCETVTLLATAQTCTNFQANTSITTFSSSVCANINLTTSSCYYDNYTCAQLPVTPLQQCSKPGLNYNACVQLTSGYCEYKNLSCQILTELDQDCNANFNKATCINLKGRLCHFLTKCQLFVMSSVTTSAEAVSKTSVASTVYNFAICANINVANAYLTYNLITQQCMNADVSPLVAQCSSSGINKNACLSKTKNLCQLKDNVCTTINRFALNSFTICDPTLNWNGCISFLKLTCKFMNGLCAPIVATDNCAALLNVQTSRYTCATRTDQACYYDTTTYFCKVPATTTVSCGTYGLNYIGCINNTLNDLCIFDDSNASCKVSFDHNLNCTALINQRKCYLVNKSANYCYFVDKQCKNIQVAALTTCVKAYSTNALTCALATDTPCQYNKLTSNCEATIPVDCVNNTSLNKLACIQSTGTQKCQWVDSSCQQVLDTSLSTIICAQSVNTVTCINISNPTQFCQFTGGKCQVMPTSPLTPKQCASIININRMEYCESPIDVACKFDSVNKRCIQIFVAELTCARGLNKLACSQINPIQKCQFDGFCYGPNDLVKCNQALLKNICLESTTMSCEWLNGLCVDLDSKLLNCIDIVNNKKLVTITVCNSAKTASVIDVCVLNTSTFNCQIIQPAKCEDVQSLTSCTYIQGLPCIFSDNKCILYNKPTLVDTCAQMNLVGSERACLDVKSKGQYCQYKDYKCIKADPITTTCTSNVSYQSCIFQFSVACVWEIKTNFIYDGSITYSYGKCQSVVVNNEMECSINLSFVACMQITKLNQMCQWTNGECQRISTLPTVIGISTLKLINQNVCSQVNTNDSAQYSTINKSCQLAKPNTDCITPGLNKVGCVSNTQQPCQWNQMTFQCTFSLKAYELALTACDIPNVSPFVCQQIIKSFGCYHSNGNCVAIPQTAKCTDAGVNMFGCLNITTTPCRWLDNQCLDYQPFTGCLSVPSYVNALVCTLVNDIACQYDVDSRSCKVQTISNKCDTLGLNKIACALVDNCIFTTKCQLEINQQSCGMTKFANYKVCANSFNKCKYSNVNYGCVPSAQTDNCNTKGLSQSGCTSLSYCTWTNDQCKCNVYLSIYPECAAITQFLKCNSLDYCYFEVSKVESTVDLTSYLQNQSQGTCRSKFCEDLDASKEQIGCYNVHLNRKLCYATVDNNCTSAAKCSDIKQYRKSSYPDCSLFQVNGAKCANDGEGQCTDLNCFNLSQSDCLKYPVLCSYDGFCKPGDCNLLSESMCKPNVCDWNPKTLKCGKQIDCAQTLTQEQCEIKMEQNSKCAWIINEQAAQVCVRNGCRYMSETMSDCSGTHIGDEVCVLLVDQSCAACEEIKDACVCLDQQKYCQLDRVTNACSSRSCRYYNKETCPDRCRYLETTNSCQPTCASLYNEYNCDEASDCRWDNKHLICELYVVPIKVEKFILPSINQSWVAEFGIIMIILL